MSAHNRTRRWCARAAALLILAIPAATWGGYSVDGPPCENPWDPGDLFRPGGPPPFNCEVDDGDLSCPAPLLRVPVPQDFDMDAFAIDEPLLVCPPTPGYTPGILFSFDDGEPGAGSTGPNHAIEIYFYDHCRAIAAIRRSYLTTITETALGLSADPPPAAADDDVDAYESRLVGPYWQQGVSLLFSPDTPQNGGLGPGSEGNIYAINILSAGPVVRATPAQLGVPDTAHCNIDGIERIYEPGTPFALLFTTDDRAPCGLDPGDIYASNLAGNYWLYADDVADLKIAISENDPVDIDALAVNTGGDFEIDGPYEPPDPTFFKADWPNHAPSGMPDFEQDHANWPPTYCGPTAVADSLWWFDSELECERDRQRGDAAETESNDTCNLADSLGEFPPIPGAFAAATDADWYVFDVPTRRQRTCTATISTCALAAPGDADTRLALYGSCSNTGVPGDLIAQNNDGCPGGQSEIVVQLQPGRYWIRVDQNPLTIGLQYTITLGLDCYPMVLRYASPDFTPDDHSEFNPEPLIRDLAVCMRTDTPPWKGTRVVDMQTCIDQWILNRGLKGIFSEQTVTAPTYNEVASEVKKSEDVVLLLGFYWRSPQGDVWTRCGGHYLAAAGVDTLNQTVTLSDPALDNAEPAPHGNGAPGSVRGPSHANHAPGAPPPPDHDNAQNVSHDRYSIGPSMVGLPASQWALPAFATAGSPTTCADVARWCFGSDYGQNPAPGTAPTPDQPCPDLALPVSAEVEAMVDVSPVQTPVCVILRPGGWPSNVRVDKGACSNPAPTAVAYDVIRGKLCNLRFNNLIARVELGHVVCLYDDKLLDEFDDLSPNHTDCFGGWFYLVRQSTDPDYGGSSSGIPRLPDSGGCP